MNFFQILSLVASLTAQATDTTLNGCDTFFPVRHKLEKLTETPCERFDLKRLYRIKSLSLSIDNQDFTEAGSPLVLVPHLTSLGLRVKKGRLLREFFEGVRDLKSLAVEFGKNVIPKRLFLSLRLKTLKISVPRSINVPRELLWGQEDLISLWFRGDHTDFASDSFADLKGLRVIEIVTNGRFWGHEELFQNLSNLEALNLYCINRQNFGSIPIGVFKGCTKLRKVYTTCGFTEETKEELRVRYPNIEFFFKK